MKFYFIRKNLNYRFEQIVVYTNCSESKSHMWRIRLGIHEGYLQDLSSSPLFRIASEYFGAVVENLPASAGDARDVGSIPGSGRSFRVGNGNPLQHSCLENPRDGGAWWATVHGVSKSQTRLSTDAKIDKTCVLINMVDYTDWFSNVKLVLHSWDKPYLDMMDCNLHI